MRLQDLTVEFIIHGFMFMSVPFVPSAQGANVKRPRWTRPQSRSASQLRNIKLREERFVAVFFFF